MTFTTTLDSLSYILVGNAGYLAKKVLSYFMLCVMIVHVQVYVCRNIIGSRY